MTASLLLGVTWGLRRLPIDLTAGYLLEGPAAILIRVLTVMPLSNLFTWFYLKTGGSLLIALLLHTSGNILPNFGFSQFEGAAVLLVLFIVIIAMVVSGASRAFQQKSG